MQPPFGLYLFGGNRTSSGQAGMPDKGPATTD